MADNNGEPPEPEKLIPFEDMLLTQAKIDFIKYLRRQGEDIKSAMSMEHVYSTFNLVEVFETALARARHEQQMSTGLDPDFKKKS